MALVVGVQIWVMRRRAASFTIADDAVAECFAVPDRPFALKVPASGPLDVVLTMHAEGSHLQGGHVAHWGVVVTLRAKRPSPSAGYRDGGTPPFELAQEVVVGDATGKALLPRVRGQMVLGNSMGRDVQAKAILARIPAGEAFVLEGSFEASVRTQVTSIWIAARNAGT
jgi:hypothetical protein